MAEKLPIVEEALRRAGGLYIKYLKDELDFQKHVASGSLKNLCKSTQSRKRFKNGRYE